MLGYTSRSSAIKQGFTHEALFFGVQHWAKDVDTDTPHLIPAFVPCGWLAQLGAFMHYCSNEIAGTNNDFVIAMQPIAQGTGDIRAAGELA